MKHFIIQLVSLLFLVAVTVSCGNETLAEKSSAGNATTHATIEEVVSNPQRYADRIVSVKGVVCNPIGVSRVSVFTLMDKTGSVKVLAPSTMAPSEGILMKVDGRVHLVYRFHRKSLCYIKQLKNE